MTVHEPNKKHLISFERYREQWRAEGAGERDDGPGHPRQGWIQRVKLQKLKCC